MPKECRGVSLPGSASIKAIFSRLQIFRFTSNKVKYSHIEWHVSMLTRSIEGNVKELYTWEATREVVFPSSWCGRNGSNPDRDRTQASY